MSRPPKPPDWLTWGFYEAVVVRSKGGCTLRLYDLLRRPCGGPVQGCHVIARKVIRRHLEARLLVCEHCVDGRIVGYTDVTDTLIPYVCPSCVGRGMSLKQREEIIHLAEWDPRNGLPGCADEHHPRFDHKGDELKIPAGDWPAPVLEFVADYELETELEGKTR